MPFDPWSGQYYSADNSLDTTQGIPAGAAKPSQGMPNAGPPPTGNNDTSGNGGSQPPPDPYFQNSPFFKGVVGMDGKPIYPSSPTIPTQDGQTGMAGTQPAPGQAGPAQTGPVNTGNSGTDRNNPPGTDLQNWFWSGTANHWVDSTGKRDATGRVLNPAEVDWWKNQDTQRAQATARGDRFNYAQPTPEVAGAPMPPAAAANPAAAATAQAQGQAGAAPKYDPLDPVWDYNGVQNVPWQAFVKNLFGENNANQLSFKELQGVLDETKMKQAEQYGWTAGVPANADANTVYRAAIALAQQNPTNDYAVVRLNVGGQPMYAALMREQDPNAQFARGYISPAKATELAQQRAAADAVARSRASSFVTSRGAGPGGPPVVPPPAPAPAMTQQQANALFGILGHALNPISDAVKKAKDVALWQQQQQNVRNAPYVPSQGTGSSNVSYPARIPVGSVSPDGRMIWDGTQWTLREVDGGMGDGQHGSGKPDAYGGN